jgi:hypothetical protein
MTCENINGISCPPINSNINCSPFQLTKIALTDQCFFNSIIAEQMSIGGADIMVYKLLGIHDQNKTTDVTGSGQGISGGDQTNFPSSNAFTKETTEWRSSQKGSNVVTSSYIGYDFGPIRLPNNREQYGVDTAVKYNIATIKIKQGNNEKNRVTRARVERSSDGIKWYGVALITLSNDNNLNEISFNPSVASRFWRIRPLQFNGQTTDYWSVQAIQMTQHQSVPTLTSIEDKVFMENRNRDYSENSITIKGQYDLVDTPVELSRFGVELPNQQFIIKIPFSLAVGYLGRPVVVGDIIELPSETQYTVNMEPVRKLLEVSSVSWDTASYSPGWKPMVQQVVAGPLIASQETQDIVGPLVEQIDGDNFITSISTPVEQTPDRQEVKEIVEQIKAEANDHVPLKGADVSNFRTPTEQEIVTSAPITKSSTVVTKGLHVEDAMPPNGLSYTQGDSFPESPSDGKYHRLTYSDTGIPTRLYRFSTAKNRWVYLETDRRKNTVLKPLLNEFLTGTRTDAGKLK